MDCLSLVHLPTTSQIPSTFNTILETPPEPRPEPWTLWLDSVVGLLVSCDSDCFDPECEASVSCCDSAPLIRTLKVVVGP